MRTLPIFVNRPFPRRLIYSIYFKVSFLTAALSPFRFHDEMHIGLICTSAAKVVQNAQKELYQIVPFAFLDFFIVYLNVKEP